MTYTPAMPSATGYPAAGGPYDGREPVNVGFSAAAPQQRLTVLVRLILVIPQLIVVYLISIGAACVAFIGWFGALFTGRLPEFAADFLAGVLRWHARVFAYQLLLTDQYPPFTFDDVDYPVRVTVRPGKLNRLAVFFRIILLLPALLVATIAVYGASAVSFIVWVIVLIMGRMPDPLHQANSAVLRYLLRCTGFYWMLTSEYPGGLYGDQPGADLGGNLYTPAGYGQPPGGYGQPAAGYGGAPASYGGPAAGYGGAQASYGQASAMPAAEVYPPAAAGYPPAAEVYPPAAAGYPPAADVYGQAPSGFASAAGQPPAAVQQAAASYGMPAMASTDSWKVPGTPPWPLVLSGGAKALVTLFLMLGVFVTAAYATTVSLATSSTNHAFVLGGGLGQQGSDGSGTSPEQAMSQTRAGFAKLSKAVTAYAHAESACPIGGLRCVTRADRKVGRAFAGMASSQAAISMPTAASRQASAALVRDLRRGRSIFHRLAGSASAAQYLQRTQKVGLQGFLQELAKDYAHVVLALNS